MVDALDLCSLFLLLEALAAAVEWSMSSVHSEVHFKDRVHDALPHGETTSFMGRSRSIRNTIHVK